MTNIKKTTLWFASLVLSSILLIGCDQAITLLIPTPLSVPSLSQQPPDSSIEIINLEASSTPAKINKPSNNKPTAIPGGTQAPADPSTTSEKSWYNLYFTSPQYPDKPQTRNRDIEDALINRINSAKSSLDISIYQLDLEEVANAIKNAKERGVTVRMVVDSHALADIDVMKNLKQEGVPMIPHNTDAIMHNKFMVVDKEAVWTGSYNWKYSCTFRNDNNAMYIKSPELARDYLQEFEKMYSEKHFGNAKKPANNLPALTVEGIAIEVCFSPEDGCAKKIVQTIKQAKKSIRFMAFSFTSNAIGDAVYERFKNGIDVKGVFENRDSDNKESELGFMKKAKMDVLTDGNPYILHHKVFIIDNNTVIMGSFNFSQNADKSNDENLLIIHNAGIAAQYLAEFERVYAVAKSSPK